MTPYKCTWGRCDETTTPTVQISRNQTPSNGESMTDPPENTSPRHLRPLRQLTTQPYVFHLYHQLTLAARAFDLSRLNLSNSILSNANPVSFRSPMHRPIQRIPCPDRNPKPWCRLHRRRGSRLTKRRPGQVLRAGPTAALRMPPTFEASKSASMTQHGRSYQRRSRSIRLTMTIGKTMPCSSATAIPVRLRLRFARFRMCSDWHPQSDA